MTTLGIIEDEAVYREGLAEFFSNQPGFDILLCTESVEAFLQAAHQAALPEIVLLDIGLPGMSGLEGILVLRELAPELDIVMLTANDDADRIFEAIQAGADAYLTKRASLQEIKETITTVRHGGSYMSPSIARKIFDHISGLAPQKKRDILTDKQEEIVQNLVKGFSYKMVAHEMDISIETVRDHIKKIYRKLQVNSKAEVIRLRLEGKI